MPKEVFSHGFFRVVVEDGVLEVAYPIHLGNKFIFDGWERDTVIPPNKVAVPVYGVGFHCSLERNDAIMLSIWKWQAIVRFLQEYPDAAMYFSGFHSETCALCWKYYDYRSRCGICPITLSTGKDECEGTPYYTFVNKPSAENALKMLTFLYRLPV